MANLILPRRSAIRTYLESWENLSPDFLWIPDKPNNLQVDQTRGVVGTLQNGAILTNGGLVNPTANGLQHLHFPTKAGITTTSAGTCFVVALVSVPSSSNTGAFFKIGNSSTGIGVGTGATTFENSGSKLIGLKEGVAWRVSTASPITAGLRLITFVQTSEAVRMLADVLTGTVLNLDYHIADAINASDDLYINGYYTNRTSNCITHALAVYNVSLTNAQYNSRRDYLGSGFEILRNRYGNNVRKAFYETKQVLYFDAGGAATNPALSLPTATSITATGVVPQVTLTF